MNKENQKLIDNLRCSVVSVDAAYELYLSGNNVNIFKYMQLNEWLGMELNKDIPNIEKVKHLNASMSLIINSDEEVHRLTPDEIEAFRIFGIVCKYFNTSEIDACSKTRDSEIIKVRKFGHLFIKLCTKLSLTNIGKHFGSKDHTTVKHSIDTCIDLIETSKLYKENYKDIKSIIGYIRNSEFLIKVESVLCAKQHT